MTNIPDIPQQVPVLLLYYIITPASATLGGIELKVNCTELATWELVRPDSAPATLPGSQESGQQPAASRRERCGPGMLPGMRDVYLVCMDYRSNIKYENHDIAIAMSPSRADPVLGLNILLH